MVSHIHILYNMPSSTGMWALTKVFLSQENAKQAALDHYNITEIKWHLQQDGGLYASHTEQHDPLRIQTIALSDQAPTPAANDASETKDDIIPRTLALPRRLCRPYEINGKTLSWDGDIFVLKDVPFRAISVSTPTDDVTFVDAIPLGYDAQRRMQFSSDELIERVEQADD